MHHKNNGSFEITTDRAPRSCEASSGMTVAGTRERHACVCALAVVVGEPLDRAVPGIEWRIVPRDSRVQ